MPYFYCEDHFFSPTLSYFFLKIFCRKARRMEDATEIPAKEEESLMSRARGRNIEKQYRLYIIMKIDLVF